MSNLERLNLSISVEDRFIDGYNLKNDIVNHLLRLNQFTFDIHAIITINNEIILPTKEYIQKTFEHFPGIQVLSYLDYFQYRNQYEYHIYTYPSEMSFYPNVSNQFPSGYYPTVRLISLYDEYPFEHEFFLQLSKSFPCVEKLFLRNQESQQHKRSSKLTKLSIVEYSHLVELNIKAVCYDYVEQFLCDERASFQNNIRLHIDFNSLLHVTNNFKRQDTRINCSKVDYLDCYGPWRSCKSFLEYFPSLKDNFDIPSFHHV
jgi:hypothetical protein